MAETYRALHLVGAAGGANLRTAVYEGRNRLVVPVVAMVEGVVWAVNSQYPELVVAEELAETPQQWNGRGCFAGHPEDGGTQVTANTPGVLERSFGIIFDTSDPARILSTRRLELEAWLDEEKAEKVGPEAVSVVRRLRAGETVEVSVGCFVESLQEEGEWDGKPYVGKWTNIVSDHLAFLGQNEEGACSVAAGCGAARHAVRHLVTAKGIEAMPAVPSTPSPSSTPTPPKPTSTPPKPGSTPTPPRKRSLMERMQDLFRLNEAGSDVSLRRLLDRELANSVIGYMGIVEVFASEGKVIYEARQDDEWQAFRQSFSLSDDEATVSLSGKPKPVMQDTSWVEIKAAADGTPEPKAACSCGGAHPPTTAASSEEKTMKDTTKAIIEKSNGKFTTEKDAAWLDAVPEDRLALFETPSPAPAPAASTTPAAPAAPAQAPAAAPVPAAAAAAPLSEEEWMKTAPASVVSIITEHKAAAAAKKTELVTALKTAQTIFSETELTAKSVEELEKLATLTGINAGIADFAGMAVPRALASSNQSKDVFANPPNPYANGLRKLRGEPEPTTKSTVN